LKKVLLPLSLALALVLQIDPRTALLEKAGWDAIAAGQPRAAAESFREALAADPRNPRLHLGAGTAAYLERRDGDAKQSLERALDLNPGLTDARLLLGQVLHRMGDLAGAIRTYEIAVSEVPGNTNALATLERWRRELDLHDRMQQAVGSHFSVAFEGPSEAALAAEALESLDRAYWRVGGILGTFPNEPVKVIVYSTEQFRDITRSPQWAAGAYDGVIRVPMRGALDNPAELDRVLAHEFTHALVRSLAARGVPTWLNEGLATLLEGDDLTWAERRVAQSSEPVSLAELQSGFAPLSGAQAALAYAASALAVRRMVEEAGGFAVANLLRDLGVGVGFDAAFVHRVQRPFADFEASMFPR
jgi:tetratricopeptide (TPR) repeat protein